VRVSDTASTSTIEVNALATTSGSDLVVLWMDSRNQSNASFYNAWAQRIGTSGSRVWTADVNVSDSGWVSANNQRLSIDTDGNDGVLVSWVDARVPQVNDARGQVYVQRLSADGRTLWLTGGVAVNLDSVTKSYQTLVADGHGGAFVAWTDSSRSFFAQHLSAYGLRLWGDTGIVNPAETTAFSQKSIAVDASGRPCFYWSKSAPSAGQNVVGLKKWRE